MNANLRKQHATAAHTYTIQGHIPNSTHKQNTQKKTIKKTSNTHRQRAQQTQPNRNNK